MRFRPNMNAAVAVGVLVASSCVERRTVVPPSRSSPWPPPFSAPSLVASDPVIEAGFATYYAPRFAGRPTANGERYDPQELTAAHRTLPFGATVEVRRNDGRRVTVRVNDRGPYGSGRIIDLSRRAADEIGIVQDGKAWVELRRVASPPPVTGGR